MGLAATLFIMFSGLADQNKQLYIVGGLLLVFGIILLLSGLITKKSPEPKGMVGIMNDLLHMPGTMGQLAIVQFFFLAGILCNVDLYHSGDNATCVWNNRFFIRIV